jgi:hypothetical protein
MAIVTVATTETPVATHPQLATILHHIKMESEDYEFERLKVETN